MKKMILSIAFVLFGSFAFANNNEIVEKSTNRIENSNEIDFKKSKKIDFNTFTEMIQKSSIEDEAKIKPVFMLYLDSCGNYWLLSYDDILGQQIGLYLVAQTVYDLTGC